MVASLIIFVVLVTLFPLGIVSSVQNDAVDLTTALQQQSPKPSSHRCSADGVPALFPCNPSREAGRLVFVCAADLSLGCEQFDGQFFCCAPPDLVNSRRTEMPRIVRAQTMGSRIMEMGMATTSATNASVNVVTTTNVTKTMALGDGLKTTSKMALGDGLKTTSKMALGDGLKTTSKMALGDGLKTTSKMALGDDALPRLITSSPNSSGNIGNQLRHSFAASPTSATSPVPFLINLSPSMASPLPLPSLATSSLPSASTNTAVLLTAEPIVVQQQQMEQPSPLVVSTVNVQRQLFPVVVDDICATGQPLMAFATTATTTTSRAVMMEEQQSAKTVPKIEDTTAKLLVTNNANGNGTLTSRANGNGTLVKATGTFIDQTNWNHTLIKANDSWTNDAKGNGTLTNGTNGNDTLNKANVTWINGAEGNGTLIKTNVTLTNGTNGNGTFLNGGKWDKTLLNNAKNNGTLLNGANGTTLASGANDDYEQRGTAPPSAPPLSITESLASKSGTTTTAAESGSASTTEAAAFPDQLLANNSGAATNDGSGIPSTSTKAFAALPCIDLVPQCWWSAKLCNNPRYSRLVRLQCPKTCGSCGANGMDRGVSSIAPVKAQCLDRGKDCPRVAFLCRTMAYGALMATECAKTCGQCDDGTDKKKAAEERMPPAREEKGRRRRRDCAEDHYPRCAVWRLQGFCASPNYSEYLKRRYCAKTCALCGDGTDADDSGEVW